MPRRHGVLCWSNPYLSKDSNLSVEWLVWNRWAFSLIRTGVVCWPVFLWYFWALILQPSRSSHPRQGECIVCWARLTHRQIGLRVIFIWIMRGIRILRWCDFCGGFTVVGGPGGGCVCGSTSRWYPSGGRGPLLRISVCFWLCWSRSIWFWMIWGVRLSRRAIDGIFRVIVRYSRSFWIYWRNLLSVLISFPAHPISFWF